MRPCALEVRQWCRHFTRINAYLPRHELTAENGHELLRLTILVNHDLHIK